ncbi:MAG: efflux RND transporter permease subunit [Steroidobacteraceae bacterium]
MRHTEFALRRPITVLMLFAALATFGAVAGRLLPLEQFPDVTFPFMGVVIPYDGSTPSEVEEQITRPVEEALATLPGIQEIRSTSNADRAQFEIQFDWGVNAKAAGYEVRNKLDSIRHLLPDTANRMQMFTASSSDQSILTVRLSAAQDLSTQYELLDRYLKKPIERLDGVARVELAGVEPRELRILLDAGSVAAYGVDLRQLTRLLQQSNFSVSAGRISNGSAQLAVRPLGEFHSINDVRQLLVRDNLRLEQIAKIELISPELQTRRNLDGRPAVGLDVFKSTDANIVDVVDKALAVVESARQLPQMQGINIFVIDNQAQSIRSSLADVRNAGLIGGLFAILVLYLFLRHWTTTAYVSLAVPLSLLITLATMYFFGLTLNVMSMMGMMLAIGMLVDNAVVVTESVFRERQNQPDDPFAATMRGVRQVGIPTLAGTATSIVVFLPIVFGDRNQITIFLTHVAIPIVVAMIASLVIAQTLIPMLTLRFGGSPVRSRSASIDRLRDRYATLLRTVLTHPRRTAAAVIAMIVATAALLVASQQWPEKLLKIDMFPQDAGRQLVLEYHIDGTYPIERVRGAVLTVEDYLRKNRQDFDIKSVYTLYQDDQAHSVIILNDKDVARLTATVAMDRILAKLPEVVIGRPSFKFDQNGGGTGFSLQLSGDSTDELAPLADDVARVLRSVKGLATVRSEALDGDQVVMVRVRRDRAAALNVTAQQVAQTVAVAMRGDRLRELRGADGELTMRLAFRANDRQDIADLAELPIYLPGGERITLAAVADFELGHAARAIQRINRLTTAVVSGTLQSDATLPVVRDAVEAIMKNYQLPPGYSWKFGRGIDQEDDTMAMMGINLLLAIVMIYLVMAAVFESSVHPLAIVTSLLLGIVGVIWTLFLTRTTMTFMALIGIQVLMGVVVNIGIVLVARINELRALGMQRLEAIVQAGADRFRPILMTTLTTLFGLAPLALGDSQLAVGIAGPSYAPMAISIMGGLAFGALTSLLLVPMFYIWIDNLVAGSANFARKAYTTGTVTEAT